MASKKRICIIGGGAAGMAAAWSLSRYPDKFDVEVWESGPEPGGVATSKDLGGNVQWINDGVQGGAPSYRNVQLLMEAHGLQASETAMTVSFGRDASCWSNAGGDEGPLLRRLAPEVRRFGQVLRWVHFLEAPCALLPLGLLLRLCGFSDEFRQLVVQPLVALFFGTGNQTHRVSAPLVARVFLDPQLRLFEYDPLRLLAQQPRMLVFPSLRELYRKVAVQAGFRLRLTWPAESLERRPGGGVCVRGPQGSPEVFDSAVLACPADVTARLLRAGGSSSWLEQTVLGAVEHFHDITLTHQDEAYMRRHYEMQLPDGRLAQYLVRGVGDRIEMSFNLSAYQPQVAGARPAVFQTILLDYERDAAAQSALAELEAGGQVLLRKRWRQPAASWRHVGLLVPLLAGLQRRGNVLLAGAWTLLNTHELAVLSGLAAADRLGAPYPFAHDPLALAQFRTYCRLLHARWPPLLVALGIFLVMFLLFVWLGFRWLC